MDDEQAIRLLHKMNPQLPREYSIDAVEDMSDKRDFNKGRLWKLKASAPFHEYCKAKGYTLKYAGDMVSCVEVGEKQRQADKKKASTAAAVAAARAGKSTSGNASGYGKKPRN
jgi:hypothetical protein